MRRLRRHGGGVLMLSGLALIAVSLSSSEGSARALPAVEVTVQTPDQPSRLSQIGSSVQVRTPPEQELSSQTFRTVPVTADRGYPFIWPAEGPITSRMDSLHPAGIDIGLKHAVEPSVRASAGGTVSFVGRDEDHEYGLFVIIDHGGGLETLYAHLSRILVRWKQPVRQGEVIGVGGQSGKSDGKHLHFEVRHNGSKIDPLHVLPQRGSKPEPLHVDCEGESLRVDSGAPLLIDFRGALADGSTLSDARIEEVNVSPRALPASASVESSSRVLFDTAPTVIGTGEDDKYRLAAKSEPAGAELSCTIFVRTRTVSPSFYVRATSTPTPVPPAPAGTPEPSGVNVFGTPTPQKSD